jgi:hypothetical protein
MNDLMTFIQSNPKLMTILFTLINTLWIAFTYFNKKKHAREIELVKQSLNLDLERRKKVFEMKVSHYENYFSNIDAIHKKHENDLQNVMNPLITEFYRRFNKAEVVKDQMAITDAATWFSEEIRQLTIAGFNEMQILEQQTNSLKLSASNEIAKVLEELRELNSEIYEASCRQMKLLSHVILTKDDTESKAVQAEITFIGQQIKDKTEQLREEMRQDLLTI